MTDIVARHVAAAVKLAQVKRFSEAASLLSELQERHASHPAIPAACGMVALYRNDGAAALDHFGLAATLDPDNPDLASNLASTYRLLGRREEAEASIDRAILLDPARPAFHLARAELVMERGDGPGALSEIETALRLGADDTEAHLVAGVILIALGQHEGAERAFRNALELAPGNLAAAHNLAELLESLGRVEDALPLSEQAYFEDPKEIDLVHGYCRRLAAVGRLDDAIKVGKRLLAAMPHHTETIALVADLQVRKGDVTAGLTALGAHVRRHPSNVEALVALARLLDQAGRPTDALTPVEQALKLDPAHAIAKQLKRELLLGAGRFAEAFTRISAEERPDEIGVVVIDPGVNAIEAVVLARLLPGLAGEDAPLLIDAEPELAGLFAGLPRCAPGRAVETPERAAVFLSELPGLIDLDLERAAGAPYLSADPDELERWRHALAEFPGPRIGLVWNRYPPGVEMAALAAAVEGIGTPVSLSIGPARRQLRDWPAAIDAGVRIGQPRDLIAAVAALDVVVGIDGLALHVAGALGRDGFVLTPARRPWYWLERDGRSRLYPSVRVIGQRAPGSWQTELATLRDALTSWAGAGEPTDAPPAPRSEPATPP